MFVDRALPDARLARCAERLAAAQSVDDVVVALCESSRRLIGSDGIAVVLRDGEFCRYVAEDAVQPLWKGQRFPIAACVSGWAMLNDEIAIVPYVASDPRVPLSAYQDRSINSLLIAPIGSPTPMAALGAYWCAMVVPGEQAISAIKTLADRATAALMRISYLTESGPVTLK